MKRPPRDKTTVSIDEKAPDIDQLLKQPAELIARALIKQSERLLKKKKNRRGGAEQARDKRKEKKSTQRRKAIVFAIVDQLERERRLRLPRTTDQKVTTVLREWRNEDGKPPGRSTLHKWLKERPEK